MKKQLLFLIFGLLGLGIFAQPVAVNDTLYVGFGETITFNPILNDYDTSGMEIKILSVSDFKYYDLISFNDSLITFKMDDYFVADAHALSINIRYQLESDYPAIGFIRLLPNYLHIDSLNVNQIRTPVYPMNIQFFDVLNSFEGPQLFYPKDSITSTIFSSCLWIGGKTVDDELHFAGERYRQVGADFWPGPLSADGNAATDSVNAGQWLRTWKISREEIINHLAYYDDPAYTMPEAIESWPAHGNPLLNQDEFIAPFVDVDQDLEYHPERGDYPFIKGDETVFFVYNDQLIHTESQGGLPLGVEIHCMAWAINDTRGDSPYNSTIFYSYRISNKSTTDYFDTYLGIFTELDLGYAWDDYVGCHVENGNFYVYNGVPIDGIGEPGSFGEHIPSQAVCILGGPFMDQDGLDNPLGHCDESINGAGFGDGVDDNERYGMNRFITFISSPFLPISWPTHSPDFYNYLKGNWKDGTSLLYGGNGHTIGGGDSLLPARFIFPGDSDSCHWGTGGIDPGALWTEETAGNYRGNKRGMASMGPFTFEAGSVEYLDIAYVTAPASPDNDSKELLQDFVSNIKQDYLVNPLGFGNQYIGIEEIAQDNLMIQVYPNPVTGDMISFELKLASNPEYSVYNTAGQLMLSGNLPAQKHQSISVSGLNSGWYILEIKTTDSTYHSKFIK